MSDHGFAGHAREQVDLTSDQRVDAVALPCNDPDFRIIDAGIGEVTQFLGYNGFGSPAPRRGVRYIPELHGNPPDASKRRGPALGRRLGPPGACRIKVILKTGPIGIAKFDAFFGVPLGLDILQVIAVGIAEINAHAGPVKGIPLVGNLMRL